MTDQELLELAAKAAGVKKTMWSDKYHIPPFPDGSIRVKPNGWNPLTDDDDALRLAVKLKLTIQQNFAGVFCYDNPDFADKSQTMIEMYEQTRTDPYAATRRAIVRAAAEIGKNLAHRL